MRVYSLDDRTTGEVIDTDGRSVERLISIEVCYIDWAISQDGVFENANLLITYSTN